VLSAPGLGSTFTVRLPLPVADQGPDAAGNAPAAAPAHPLTVLVAEDNDLNQVIARATLEAAGLTVEVVPDGAAAVAAATGREFAAVFMDCQMPVVDGLEATRRIRAAERTTGRHVPIIAMTASTSDSDRSACAAAGMDHFLPKPWTREQLHAALALVRTASPAPVPVPAPGIAADVLARLDELLDGVPADDAAAMRTRMLDSFVTRAPAMLDALSAALQAGDDDEVARQAHALRGMAANLGLGELARLAAAVELGESTGDAAAPALAAAFDEVTASLGTLVRAPARSSGAPAPPMERS
jgi:CheY-like chemotaxis protein